MKYKKGFSAVLLTLIISTLLPISAFAASDGFSDVPEASPFYESVTFLGRQGITYGTGNGSVCTGYAYYSAPMGDNALPGLVKKMPFRILTSMAVMPVSNKAMQMDG